jgi:NAD(P)H-dependent flavin oxidoreductase YrpB (nitropropane dioxygenase family)
MLSLRRHIDPAETIAFMAKVRKPWIAYKVLAAGAIQPGDGFRYALENGADFALVGMFDFQIASDAAITRDLLAEKRKRPRAWLA